MTKVPKKANVATKTRVRRLPDRLLITDDGGVRRRPQFWISSKKETDIPGEGNPETQPTNLLSNGVTVSDGSSTITWENTSDSGTHWKEASRGDGTWTGTIEGSTTGFTFLAVMRPQDDSDFDSVFWNIFDSGGNASFVQEFDSDGNEWTTNITDDSNNFMFRGPSGAFDERQVLGVTFRNDVGRTWIRGSTDNETSEGTGSTDETFTYDTVEIGSTWKGLIFEMAFWPHAVTQSEMENNLLPDTVSLWDVQ